MKPLFIPLLLLFIWSSNLSIAQDSTRIIVISGGGARGAWGAGLAKHLIKDKKKDYHIAIGTSTGSLMGPLVLLHKFDTLEKAYTQVTPKSIFNVNPFNSKGDIRALNGIWRALFYRTLGESKNLHTRIEENFTLADYNKLKKSGKEFLATVTNMADYGVYYMSTKRYTYDSTVNWIWASANQPVFMSIYETETNPEKKNREKKTCYWQDGGLREAVPMSKAVTMAIARHIHNIDVIVHGTRTPTDINWKQKGVLTGLERTIDILTESVKHQNIEVGVLMEKLQNCKDASGDGSASDLFTVNVYYMPEEDYNLLSNSLLFDPAIMRKLWDSGAKGHARRSMYRMTGASLQKMMVN